MNSHSGRISWARRITPYTFLRTACSLLSDNNEKKECLIIPNISINLVIHFSNTLIKYDADERRRYKIFSILLQRCRNSEPGWGATRKCNLGMKNMVLLFLGYLVDLGSHETSVSRINIQFQAGLPHWMMKISLKKGLLSSSRSSGTRLFWQNIPLFSTTILTRKSRLTRK